MLVNVLVGARASKIICFAQNSAFVKVMRDVTILTGENQLKMIMMNKLSFTVLVLFIVVIYVYDIPY